MKPRTRIHYATRLEPVLRWLAAHPDAAPDLYYLADLACLSPYHFHRVYRGLMGETVKATMLRARMHRASVELAEGRPLNQVAARAGYTSVAAFNRAFGSAFGMPPGRYRQARSSPFNPEELGMYPITIETFEGATLATIAHQGDYQEIGATFDQLFLMATARGLVNDATRTFGVYFDDPEQVPADDLRALAGLTLPAGHPVDKDFDEFTLPITRCAVLHYTGPYSEIEAAYQWLLAQWLPASGEETRDFPIWEEYLNDPKTTPAAELQTRIYLPLA
ncbi:GyrI-like domain-containing protein [Bordetella sp. 15P40C-2]|uniref:AraC family transcriptional regulator n=1 Tax=Bordetella sp. 15P40C-2 TaxID=2572246 RepID=UPI00132C496B|nr:AraC family transcriptional regulator [Bordetella sp. 15P40C-2]MVW71301.1 helix-turn-helix domain-containing protein [Bordetella sp. 15P40C-2]